MHIQILNLLALLNFCASNNTTITLLQRQFASSRSKEIFNTRNYKMRNEFVFRTSRFANKVNQHVNFEETFGLKRRMFELSWRVLDATYDQLNSCAWPIVYKCQNCRETDNFLNLFRDQLPKFLTVKPQQQNKFLH